LLAQAGWGVEVLLYGDPARLPADARKNHDRWVAIGTVAALEDASLEGYAEAHPGLVLAIDALFGTGLIRPFDALAPVRAVLNRWRVGAGPHVVAVDIPSGICADSGRYLGAADLESGITADLTVSFHRRKLGHVLAEGAVAAGRVVVGDIGLEQPVDDTVVRVCDVSSARLSKGVERNKFGHGHALVLAGGVGRGGAARLAARGALRIGAGLVSVGCPPAALIENAAALDAVMLRRVADGAGLKDALGDRRITALCLGPGMGTGPREVGLVQAALGSGRRLVLDADALTILAQEPDLFAMLHEGCVLTPHGGEFARLFPDVAARLAVPATTGPAFSKVDATGAAAAQAGCIVLFKGADTVIAAPDGQCRINAAFGELSAPWLATAGSGDVLAGFVTGLLARGLPPLEAAEVATRLHVECARAFGPGLIAEDLHEALPGVMRALGV